MNGLTILYVVGACLFGFIIGMLLEMFYDNEILFKVRSENEKLRSDNEKLRSDNEILCSALEKAKKTPEIVEIIDKRQTPTNFTFPNNSGF